MSRCAMLWLLVCIPSFLLAQAEWKEIPVGYNMPKAALSADPAVPAPFPTAPKGNKNHNYSGEGRDMSHPWEIDFHAGGFLNTDSGGGSAAPLPSGTSFFGGNSQQVSSYMFGDGAALFNQVSAATAITHTITPLDPVLGSQFGKRNSGPAIGIRLGRDITPRFNLEFSLDWNASPLGVSDSKLLNVQTTATSFQDSFTDLFSNSCGCSNVVGAIPSLRRSEGSQLFWTGAVNVYLKTSGKTLPYLTFGGGGLSNLGPAPHAGIFGEYSFTAGGPHNETDLINIEASEPRNQGVGILGFGVKYFATPRWGLRFDVRDYISPNDGRTLLSATPTVLTLTPPEEIGPPTVPTLRFSNDPTLGQSSLSGPALNRFRTFNGDGINNQINISVGVLYRF